MKHELILQIKYIKSKNFKFYINQIIAIKRNLIN